MKKKYLSQRIRHSLRHMRLSDRCLCLFLLFLLLQSAWHIFCRLTLQKNLMPWMPWSAVLPPPYLAISSAMLSEVCRKKVKLKFLWKAVKNPCGIPCNGNSSTIRYKLSYLAANPYCCRCRFFLTDHPHLCTDVYFSIPRCHSFPFPIPEFSSVQHRIFGWTCKIWTGITQKTR